MDGSRLRWDLIGFKKGRWCEGVLYMLWLVELNLHLQCMIIGENMEQQGRESS